MARKPVGMPTGVELVGKAIRIRFMRNGHRCCETLPYPQTPQGIAAAAGLRAQVVQLSKLGLLTDEKYLELFPNTSYVQEGIKPLFGQYAQTWLDSRDIVLGTRKNYLWSLNLYWMPHLGMVPLDQITPMRLRKVLTETDWPSPSAKRAAIQRLGAVLRSAVRDELIPRNPVDSIELPKKPKKVVDPFTKEEADKIIAWLYENLKWQSKVYACNAQWGALRRKSQQNQWPCAAARRKKPHETAAIGTGIGTRSRPPSQPVRATTSPRS